MKTEVVHWQDVEDTIRSAIRVHAKKAGHKGNDVQMGCQSCLLLLAMNTNLRREVVLAEVESTA